MGLMYENWYIDKIVTERGMLLEAQLLWRMLAVDSVTVVRAKSSYVTVRSEVSLLLLHRVNYYNSGK